MGPSSHSQPRKPLPDGVRRFAVIGGGGHGRVIIDLLRTLGWGPIVVVDNDPAVARRLPVGVTYLGGDDALDQMQKDETLLANGLGSVGRVTYRRQIFDRLTQRGFTFATLCHPSAVVAADATLEQGAQVMAGGVVQTGARIGHNVLVNTRASVDHDCNIGEHSHLAPGVVLSGGVQVGIACHIGTGAVVIQNIIIGAEAVIGAGSAVLRNVDAGATFIRSR